MKEKKGEITTAQIVTIIILIVSFIVILYFFFRLNLGATTNSEICHNSVVLQAKSAKLVGALQCKTDYVCISGGGTCENLNPTITLKVDSTKKNETMKALADQMANCWWMFGEGKLDYLELSAVQGTVTGGRGCAVCSVVGFDNKINSISYGDFIDYLAKTKKDDTQTYLQYLYGASNLQELNPSGAEPPYASWTISNADTFSIITGESKGAFNFWGRGDFLPPILLKTSDVSKELTECGGNFFTQT